MFPGKRFNRDYLRSFPLDFYSSKLRELGRVRGLIAIISWLGGKNSLTIFLGPEPCIFAHIAWLKSILRREQGNENWGVGGGVGDCL